MPTNAGYLASLYSLKGKVAVITGGMGVLGSEMVKGMARAGAKVAFLDRGRRTAEAEQRAAAMEVEGFPALAIYGDVLDAESLKGAREAVLARWGRIDILINGAGGNKPDANVTADKSIVDISTQALHDVLNLNLMGTLIPCQIFGAAMIKQREGCIINISSMAALRAMTLVVGYSAAKAAVDNLTRWLAVEFGRKYGAGLRVNAIAPGFFIGEQNRRLLLNEDGSLTERGKAVIAHTPAGRFGEAKELIGLLIWLCSPSASFVTGTVIPVDGGFSIFSGV